MSFDYHTWAKQFIEELERLDNEVQGLTSESAPQVDLVALHKKIRLMLVDRAKWRKDTERILQIAYHIIDIYMPKKEPDITLDDIDEFLKEL